MKTLLIKSLKSGMIFTGIAFLLIFTFGSCAKKIVFPVSTVVPAASATVCIKTDKNKNYALTLSVKNIAGPERLQPVKKAYVVWIETAQKGTINLGRLNVSKGLRGSLKAITPFRPTVVFITAEDDTNIKNPGMQVVLKTESFELKN